MRSYDSVLEIADIGECPSDINADPPAHFGLLEIGSLNKLILSEITNQSLSSKDRRPFSVKNFSATFIASSVAGIPQYGTVWSNVSLISSTEQPLLIALCRCNESS